LTTDPPSAYTLAGLALAYALYTVARSTVVASAARRRAPVESGKPAIPAAVLNTLYVCEIFLVAAASYVATRWALARFPGVPAVAAWAVSILGLFFVRAFARVLLPRRAAEVLGAFVLPVVKFGSLLLWPMLWLVRRVGKLVAAITRAGTDPDAVSPSAEVMGVEIAPEARLGEDEREMIDGIFSIRDTVAREVMIPRVDMVTADVRDPLAEIKKLVIDKGISRIPIVDESPDNVLGILHAKDIFRLEEKGADVRSVLRTPAFVPETKKVNELLREFRASKTQLAIVVDEYGGTAGLITLEDVIEEIVGEIHDEYDAVVKLISRAGPQEWMVAGRMDIEELNEKLGVEIPREDFETLGGFISSLAGKVPAGGERVEYENMAFEVIAADARRVKQVRLTLRPGKGA
jgi:putative hemolysin